MGLINVIGIICFADQKWGAEQPRIPQSLMVIAYME